jgi:hypothetical protein
MYGPHRAPRIMAFEITGFPYEPTRTFAAEVQTLRKSGEVFDTDFIEHVNNTYDALKQTYKTTKVRTKSTQVLLSMVETPVQREAIESLLRANLEEGIALALETISAASGVRNHLQAQRAITRSWSERGYQSELEPLLASAHGKVVFWDQKLASALTPLHKYYEHLTKPNQQALSPTNA